MIIRYLKLTNYRRFAHAELELPSGIIGIIGLNGTGKSTLVEAIAWALYGNQPEITRTSKGDVKRSGTSTKDPCSVELEFSLDGNNYRLIREIRGKAQTINAELHVNGQLEARTAKDTTEYLVRKLGMDYKSFFASVFARQKELNALSSKQAGDRKQLVLRMLNIERLERVKRSVGGDRRATKNYLEGLSQSVVDSAGQDLGRKLREEQNVLTGQQDKLASEIGQIEKDKLEKEKTFQRIADELEVYARKYSEYRTLRSELDKIEKIIAALTADMSGYERQLSALEADEKKLEGIREQNEKYEGLLAEKEKQEEAKDKFSRLKNLNEQLAENDQKIKELSVQHTNFTKQLHFFAEMDKNITELDAEQKELEASLTEVNAGHTRCEQILAQLRHEIKEQASHRDSIADLGPESTCPTCDRPLEDHYEGLLNKLDSELEKKNGEAAAREKELVELERQRKELGSKKAELDKREVELEQGRLKREEIRARLAAIVSERKGVGRERLSLESRVNALGTVGFDPDSYESIKGQIGGLKVVHEQFVALKSAVERKPELRTKLDGVSTELKKITGSRSDKEKTIAELDFDEGRYEQLQDVRNAAGTVYQQAVADLKMRTQELAHLKDKMAGVEEQLLQVTEKKKKIEEKKEQLDYLSTLENVLDKFKMDLISRIRPLLSQYSSDFLKKLTEGRYSQLELDENYDIFIYDNGEKYELKRFSGGEEDIANLSLRLAISRVIAESAGTTGLNLIILDEIFGSQDAYRKRNIITVLQELSNQYQQIFLITHVEEMKELMGFVLDVHADSEGDSSEISVMV